MEEIVTWLISVIGGGAVVTLIGRHAISHVFSRDLERFRINLEKQVAVDLAEHKAKLDRQHTEHQAKFEWLLGRRTETLAKLHDLWLEAFSSTRQAAMRVNLVEELNYSPVGEPLSEAAMEACRQLEKGIQGARLVTPENVLVALVGAANEASVVSPKSGWLC